MSHLGFDFPGTWMHVDMAAPVHAGERATGYGVALLATLFGRYTGSSLLRNISPELQDRSEDSRQSDKKKMRLNKP